MAVIPTTSVDLSTEIGQVLNDAGGSVNINQPLTYFTESAKINKWSKKKPVNIKQDFIANLTDKIRTPSPIDGMVIEVPWYLGEMGSSIQTGYNLYDICGMWIPIIHSIDDSTVVNIIDNYATNGANWEAVAIKDGYPRRLGDFRGYSTEVGSPIYTHATPLVYAGSDESINFSISDNAEDSEHQVSMEDISMILDDSFERGVIIKSSSTILGFYGSGESATNGGIGANWYTRLSVGTYTVYFVARSTTLEKTFPYPSTSEYPNPVTVQVVSYANPATNPFNKLSYDLYGEGGFAYNNTVGYFEPMYNVNENDYTTLNTTGSYCLRIDYTADEDTTLNFQDIHFEWMFTGSGSGKGRPIYRPIINGVSYANNSYTFLKGVKTSVYYQFDDIFYDDANSTRYSPTQGENFNLDPMTMHYNTAVQEYIEIDITYDQYQNGYFYNSSDGYYQSK